MYDNFYHSYFFFYDDMKELDKIKLIAPYCKVYESSFVKYNSRYITGSLVDFEDIYEGHVRDKIKRLYKDKLIKFDRVTVHYMDNVQPDYQTAYDCNIII